jgi:hypothetical protein
VKSFLGGSVWVSDREEARGHEINKVEREDGVYRLCSRGNRENPDGREAMGVLALWCEVSVCVDDESKRGVFQARGGES